MIRRLRVQGWRAFDDLALELDEGVTFVIAENGVGKTSLVEAAAWGLYGALSGVDARAARRAGSAETTVELEVELPDDRTLNVERRLGDRGEKGLVRLGGMQLDDDSFAKILAEAFGASREFLAKTTVIPSSGVADDTHGAFHLRSHLCHVFGVDALEEAAGELERLRADAEAVAKKVRQASRQAAVDLTGLRSELVAAEAAVGEADAGRAAGRVALDVAQRELEDARKLLAARERVVAATRSFSDLLMAVSSLFATRRGVQHVTSPAELAERLGAAELEATEALDSLRREQAMVDGRVASLHGAISDLRGAGAECPVCRRPLSPGDRAQAERGHSHELEALVESREQLAAEVISASQQLGEIRRFARQAERLPDIETDFEDRSIDIDAATLRLEQAREEADRLVDHAARLRAQRDAIASRIADEERDARDAEAAFLAHRRAAVTSVAAEVMRLTADAILANRIDPLTAEIGHRWKKVFGERGELKLRPDGRLVLVRGVHELPFAVFSSGEKVVALLAARLLVLGASTRASFLWLDEPLEHLDPKNRRLIASLMSASGRHIRQILVTTYEEALARRLAAAAAADIRYVRAAEG